MNRTSLFKTVLIANRGEIACRAIRSLRRLGIQSVAVYSDGDRNAIHVREADVAVALGGERADETYLSIDKLLAAARETGTNAIYPGYGFLSESAEFAERCEAEGIVFIGPTPVQIRDFGLKHRARELAQAAEVPLTPGSELLEDVEAAVMAAERIGYPVMLKSTAGGGGIGMMRCADASELRAAYDSVVRLGTQYFSDSGVFLERCIDDARHVEVQILGDGRGNVVALGERDCSLQRRHQKVVEETPAPHLPPATRERLLEASVRLGEQVGYRSAGTIEFIFDPVQNAFYFLEVNTRLQVEHPVTEAVTGLDLIEQMLRVAAGETLDPGLETLEPQGAAIEVRLYAENPLKDFQPSPGMLDAVQFPSGLPGVRIDAGVESGSEVSAHFDPMIAKLIVHGCDRDEAIVRMRTALESTRLYGIPTNLDYLRAIVASPMFSQGEVSTRALESLHWAPRCVEVITPGTYTSVQDVPGRVGYWDIGVPPSGPMDDMAFRLANRVVGNPSDAAALECTLVGPKLRFHRDGVISLTGGATSATLDDQSVPHDHPVAVKAGQVLAIGQVQSGCRCYLAVRGGLDVPIYLGSRSTFALGQFGGYSGRTLVTGDLLDIAEHTEELTTPAPAPASLLPSFESEWRIGVLVGPHGAPDFFTQTAFEQFFATDWEVHYNANRLGVRLVGPQLEWARSDGGEAGLHPSNVHDCEYAIGAVNFTGDSPVILMKDGPSLGGFVCPVTVAKGELWKVGQVKPGDRIRFVPISLDQAQRIEVARLEVIETLSLPDGNAVSLPETVPPALIQPRVQPSGAVPVASHSPCVLASRPAENARPAAVYRQAGDSYILLEYGENVLDLTTRLRVHLLMEAIRDASIDGVLELAPGVRSLQIRYDGHRLAQHDLLTRLQALDDALADPRELKMPTRVLHLPMAFEDSATLDAVQRYSETVKSDAPWLPNNVDFIARINGIAREEVERILFEARYLVLGLGDVYLGAPCAVPVDPRHRLLSSKYNPARTHTAEGTVGIGGMYMCIYGMDSPGGYQLVGRTVPIWNTWGRNAQFAPGAPWLLRFFDQVRFYPVSESELARLRDDFRHGRLELHIDEETFDVAEYLQFLESHADSIANFHERQRNAFDDEVSRWNAADIAPPAIEQAEAAPVENVRPGMEQVAASIAGNVWKFVATPGAWVEAGEPLVILEAMKMEVAVNAPVSGKLDTLLCEPGRAVKAGEVVAMIDTAVQETEPA
ncbi:urea carboxylase [Chromohalobacter sarecensis]|uniref:Urea carboxylase n=1 Tax=Chromohalobacter sarecensis TaxID=245294 RepID=A0ABV9D3L3_9GAMM|nr:urea carboxylase [Chromohalobacter sarecensis]MCK0714505.1 urea carboxylase [Chromohalobacter sarecensis]